MRVRLTQTEKRAETCFDLKFRFAPNTAVLPLSALPLPFLLMHSEGNIRFVAQPPIRASRVTRERFRLGLDRGTIDPCPGVFTFGCRRHFPPLFHVKRPAICLCPSHEQTVPLGAII